MPLSLPPPVEGVVVTGEEAEVVSEAAGAWEVMSVVGAGAAAPGWH